jgi:type I restriction enzyme S subunit
MSKQLNIPTLRFPEFKGEWERRKLGEVAEIGRGKSKHRPRDADFLFGGKYPFIQTGDVRKAELYLTEYTQTYSEAGLKQSKLWNEDTLCITIAANIAETAILKIKACFPDSVIGLIPKENATTVLFVKHLFDKFKIQIQSLSQGAAQDNLNQEKLSNIEFVFPTLPEQTKIAEFFTAIDAKIQALKTKKEKLQQYKKGVMQQLFTPSESGFRGLKEEQDFDTTNPKILKSSKSRFRQENGKEFPDWEVKKLGEIGETYGGLSGKTKENFGIGKPYIQYKQIFDDSKIDISRFELVDIGENENQNKVQFGDVFFTVSSETPNEIGMSSVLLDSIEELYLNSFCFGFRANSLEKLSPYFSQYLFRSENFRTEIIKLAQGSTRYNMSKIQLLKIEIQLPCLEEQTKIANFLSSIDEKINHTATQIEKMEVWKKGLLQKMFV